MAGPIEDVANLSPIAPNGTLETPGFLVSHQEVELNIDFATRTLTGRTAIRIEPSSRDLKLIRLRCRQVEIKAITVDKWPVATFDYSDPYKRLKARDGYTVYQHHLIHEKLEQDFQRVEPELTIPLPRQLRIQPQPSTFTGKDANLAVPLDPATPRFLDDSGLAYQHFTVYIDYVIKSARDGLHWVGLQDGDQRYPHVYTHNSALFGPQSCFVFPCVDAAYSKHTWRFTFNCPRTLADLATPAKAPAVNGIHRNGNSNGTNGYISDTELDSESLLESLSEEERGLDVSVVCSGYMEDNDAPIEDKATRRKWVFYCNTPVPPRHVGFTIGPFEELNLSEFRESEQDDKLGQSAVSIHGFCLPGRADEMRNTCMPLAMAMDKFTTSYVLYPFESKSTSYKVCFVDDLPYNVSDTATLSICSSRLLVPVNILDPLYESTRELVNAVASQWLGVKVVPRTPQDTWIVVGGSYFMTDLFMMTLWGKNEHRYRLKQAADKIVEQDVRRPSVFELGPVLGVDSSEAEFLKLKTPVILFILHHRLVKASGRNGVDRILCKMLLDEQVGKLASSGKLENGGIDTERFMRTCEKVGHQKVDAFFNQWVYGAGCPTFRVTQRFNKKKLVVEMLLVQAQPDDHLALDLTPDLFMREVKEHEEHVYAGQVQPLFTGPMTIRIHEADGTPYEHIVDIKEITTKVEIPYNTKYKRLKRNRRQKERTAAATGLDVTGEVQDDVLLYCLGDVLQTEEDMRTWDLADWTKEDEDRMNQESYEWIRLDKDFEWITNMTFNQPHYMWVSQLQQDNDVVAQVESIQYLKTQQPFKLVSTILTRTLMDQRYFYGVRLLATEALSKCATPALNWVGLTHLEKAFQEFFCFENSAMTRFNDFTDMRSYKIQCAIPQAIAHVRDTDGKAPDRVKKFFIDKLKFNDNSNNEYSDSFYVATLMSCLAQSLVTIGDRHLKVDFGNYEQAARDAEFERNAIEEIQRFRRIDEWIPSFQNLYTVTALECLKLLMQNRVAPRRLADFIVYTRPENSAPVRLKAFECLVDLGVFTEPAIMHYYFDSLSTEQSPYLRASFWRIMGQGLGRMALIEAVSETQASTMDLVIEGDAAEVRQAALARTQTIQGAVAALKARAGDIQELKDALIDALRSPEIGIEDYENLLTVCKMLYEPKDSLMFKFKLPTYWQVRHIGDGKLIFKSTGRYRTTPIRKLELKIDLKRPRPPASDDTETASPQPKRARISINPPAAPSPKPINIAPVSQIPPLPPAAPAPPPVSRQKPAKVNKKPTMIVRLKLKPEILKALPPDNSVAFETSHAPRPPHISSSPSIAMAPSPQRNSKSSPKVASRQPSPAIAANSPPPLSAPALSPTATPTSVAAPKIKLKLKLFKS